MLIDLYCEPIIRTMYGESEVKQIFSFAYKHYLINYTTLKNYAKRRKRYEEINNFILNNIDSSINNLLL